MRKLQNTEAESQIGSTHIGHVSQTVDSEAQRARVENAGVLTASGLIAGEAILGLVWAGLQFTPPSVREHLQLFANPSYWIGLVVLAVLAVIIVRAPLRSAGSPDEPAPPVAMM